MKHSSQWAAMGWLIAIIGIALCIVAETPHWGLPAGMGTMPVAMAVFTVGVMGRSLVRALDEKPDIMSTRYIVYTWGVIFAAAFVVGIEFVGAGYVDYLTAMVIVFCLGIVYSHLVGEIEARDEYEPSSDSETTGD